MNLFLNCFVTMTANLLLFGMIPFIWWLVFHRKKENFFHWIGFYKPKLTVKWWILILFLAVYIFYYEFDFYTFLDQETLAYLESNASVGTGDYTGIGIAGLIPAVLVNVIGNGVAEEVLFRGFFCKRLCAKFGAVCGSLIQAALFGFMHNALALLAGMEVSFYYHCFVFLSAGGAALLLGLVNEKLFNKSIWPSVILHGIGNAIPTIVDAFQ